MTIRRADFWHVKAGRNKDFIEQFKEFKSAVSAQEPENMTLVRVSAGGQGPELYYGFADANSMEAYGAFMDSVRGDNKIQELWAGFFAPDSAATYFGTSIMTRIAEHGAAAPRAVGSVGLLRVGNVKPGYDPVARATQAALAKHYEPLGGHSEAWRLIAAGPMSGNVVTSLAFPSMTALGKWMDKEPTISDVREALAPWISGDPPAQMLTASIATVVAV
jgi:hypothetical protein